MRRASVGASGRSPPVPPDAASDPKGPLKPPAVIPDSTPSIPRPGVVVDLEVERARRLLRPWPGWWGGLEVRSWTWAERSRRSA